MAATAAETAQVDSVALDVEAAQVDASSIGAPEFVAASPATVGAPAASTSSTCEHCGTTVPASRRFCPTCGRRVNAWRTLPDLGPDAGVSLVPAAAAILTGIEPPPRVPVRVIALAVGSVIVIALAVIVGVLMFGPRPEGLADHPWTGRGGEFVRGHARLAVEVQVDQTLGVGEDPWSDVEVGGPCEPVREVFPDIRSGTRVLVADQSGAVVAQSTLPAGRKSASGLCSFLTRLPAPDASRYGIGIADRTAIVFSFDELFSGRGGRH